MEAHSLICKSVIFTGVGNVAYVLEFPDEKAAVHLVFHIYLFLKCVGNVSSLVPL